MRQIVEALDFDLDLERLQKEYQELDIDNLLMKSPNNQLAVQTTDDCPVEKQLNYGTGSLLYDWSNLDEHGNPTKIENKRKQFEFTKISDHFKGSYFDEIISEISERYFPIHRSRFMMSKPKSCLSTHKDVTRRVHIPIYTNEDCYMVFTDQVCRLPYGKIYVADTTVPHTAVNASNQLRTHFVMCVHEEYK